MSRHQRVMPGPGGALGDLGKERAGEIFREDKNCHGHSLHFSGQESSWEQKRLARVSLVHSSHRPGERGRGPVAETTQALTTRKLTTSGWGMGEAIPSQNKGAWHSFEG